MQNVVLPWQIVCLFMTLAYCGHTSWVTLLVVDVWKWTYPSRTCSPPDIFPQNVWENVPYTLMCCVLLIIGGNRSGSNKSSVVKNEVVDFEWLSVPAGSSTSATDYFPLVPPAYQSEVIIPAVGSPVVPGCAPATTVSVSCPPPARSSGWTDASVWRKVFKSTFVTGTKDRPSQLPASTTTTTTTCQ